MYSSKRAWKIAVHWNEKLESRDGNSQHPRIDSNAEVAGSGSDHSDTSEEIIEPGFYQPANCEDGDPMKNEQKLRSFTGPLVGYEASGRVAVILQTVNRTGGRGHPRILDTVSDTISPNFIVPGREAVRTLRGTTSDLQPKRPLWVSPCESRTIAPVASLEINLLDRTFPRSTDTKDSQTPEHESSPSSEMTTNSFGAVGDGRLTASSQLLPSSGRSMRQTGRGFEGIDYSRGENSIRTSSRLPDSPANRYPQRGLKSMILNNGSNVSSFESFPPPHEALGLSQFSKSGGIPHGRGRASYNDSDPPSLTETGPSFARRVSRALPSTNPPSSGKHGAAEVVKILAGQNQAPLATGTVDAVEPAASKRESPRYTLAVYHADHDVDRANPHTNPAEIYTSPRTFSLPSETVVFVMKSDNTHDIDAAVKNGIWCSSYSGNRVLDSAWRRRKPGETIMLFFSVVKSSQYCGLAEMTGPYNEDARPDVFSEKDRQGIIPIRWIFVKYAAFKHFENVILSRSGLSVNELRNASMVPDNTARAMIQTYLVAPSEALTNVKRDYPVSHLRNQSGADHRRSGSTGLPSIPQPGVSLPARPRVPLPSAPAVPLPPRPDTPLLSGPPESLPPRPNVPLPPPIEHLPYLPARVEDPISLPPASPGGFRPGRVVGATNITFHERSFHERILSQGQHPRAVYAVDPAHFRNHSLNTQQASSVQRQPSDTVHATRNLPPTPTTGPSNMRYRQSNSGQVTQGFYWGVKRQNAGSRGFRPNPQR